MLRGNVFITGGAGFLGRAILRRAERESWPAQFTIYSRDEEKQHQVRERWPQVHCVLGDVRNLERLIIAMQGHETVIHASAVKFVPEAEYNVAETIEVNVNGSINVAMAARAAGVRNVIGVSTDKACLPVNLYGATKMVMERLFSEADLWGDFPRFIVTRYGNVIGSTGSIVPVFRRQLAQYGRVSVTDPEMTRFWLSPDAAVRLIVECYEGINWGHGCIFLPRPGSMSIGNLARVVAGEAPVEYIGARPGEKKHEALVSAYECDRTIYRPSTNGEQVQMIIYPATHEADLSQTLHPLMAYTSDNADSNIQPDAMAALIEDAATI